MSEKDKLIARLLSRPTDFTFDELSALLGQLGYSIGGTGKTGGSRAAFTNGDSVNAILEDFHSAVDEYLDFCAQNGKQPEKPFKGSFNVRIGADLHRKAALTASARGVSLNTLVEDAIRQTVST